LRSPATNYIAAARGVIEEVAASLGLEPPESKRTEIDRLLANHRRAFELFRQAPPELIITKEQYSRKVEFLSQAISADGRFAMAYEALAHARIFVSDWQSKPSEVMPDARREALKAFDLDDTLPDVHRAVGRIAFQ
jgi:hypothetical protein